MRGASSFVSDSADCSSPAPPRLTKCSALQKNSICRGIVFVERIEKGGIELWADPSASSLFTSWCQGLVGEAEVRSSWWLCWQGWKEGAKGDIGEAANLGQTRTRQR